VSPWYLMIVVKLMTDGIIRWIRSNAVFCTGNDSGSDFENYFCAYFLTEIRKYRNMDGMAVWMARSYWG